MKLHEKTFVPRLPEAAQKRLKSGGAHRNKNAYQRSAEKRETQRQLKDIF
ncbi:MAG: hypothetical protein Q7R65_01405 [bacterium]|nr:hypothetical protein [bacterium]